MELKDFTPSQLAQMALDLVRRGVSREEMIRQSQLCEADVCLLESVLRSYAYKLFSPQALATYDRKSMPYRVKTREETAFDLRIMSERRKINCKYVPKSVPFDVYYGQKISTISSVIIQDNGDVCYFLRRYEDWVETASIYHIPSGNFDVAFCITANVLSSLPLFLVREDVLPFLANKKSRMVKLIEMTVQTLALSASVLGKTDDASRLVEQGNDTFSKMPLFSDVDFLYI